MNKHEWEAVYREYARGQRESFVQHLTRRGGFIRYSHEDPRGSVIR